MRTTRRPDRRKGGYTLVELVITIAIIGILSSIGGTRYLLFVEKARVVSAVADLDGISAQVDGFVAEIGFPPPNLADLDLDGAEDPWGYEYKYYQIVDRNGTQKLAGARKDRFLVPLNTLYDLYSIGADGKTTKSLNHPSSYDDVVRANDGSFYGLGRLY